MKRDIRKCVNMQLPKTLEKSFDLADLYETYNRHSPKTLFRMLYFYNLRLCFYYPEKNDVQNVFYITGNFLWLLSLTWFFEGENKKNWNFKFIT